MTSISSAPVTIETPIWMTMIPVTEVCTYQVPWSTALNRSLTYLSVVRLWTREILNPNQSQERSHHCPIRYGAAKSAAICVPEMNRRKCAQYAKLPRTGLNVSCSYIPCYYLLLLTSVLDFLYLSVHKNYPDGETLNGLSAG